MNVNFTPDQFEKSVSEILAGDTSAQSQNWTSGNPFLGHCTVVSLLALDLFGGDVMRVSLHKVPGFEDVGWHSWNRLPDGKEIDFTKQQFEKPLPENIIGEVKSREELLSYSTIKERYELLKSRFDSRFKTL